MKVRRDILLLVGLIALVGCVVAEEPTYIDFIHYVNGTSIAVTPDGAVDAAAGYRLLGCKWKSLPVTYYVNPVNNDGIAGGDAVQSIVDSFDTWDYATSKHLFSYGGTTVDTEYNVRNYQNTVMFGSGLGTSIIGQTRVWIIPTQHKIVETDMKLNEYFYWSALYNPSRMILQDIVTHEAGHVCGLKDLYGGRWRQLTMYGLSSYGETKKITLARPDKRGLRRLYGS